MSKRILDFHACNPLTEYRTSKIRLGHNTLSNDHFRNTGISSYRGNSTIPKTNQDKMEYELLNQSSHSSYKNIHGATSK